MSLLTLALALLLAGSWGCAFRYPVTLERTDTLETVTRTVPSGQLLSTVTPHADGLGWTVDIQEWVTVETDQTTRFVWSGLEQQIDTEWYSLNPVRLLVRLAANAIHAFGCPYTIPLALLQAAARPYQPSFVYPLKVCPGIVGYRFRSTTFHDEAPSTRILRRQTSRPVPSGHLLVRFAGESVGFFTTIWTPDDQGRVVLRIQDWHPHDPPSPRDPVVIDLRVPDHAPMAVPLPLTAAQLVALRDESHTPTLIPPVRILASEPALDPWQHAILDTLSTHSLPVLADPETTTFLKDRQATFHRGPYTDQPAIAPGHARAARTLIRLSRPDQALIRVQAFDLASGTLQASLLVHERDTTPQQLATTVLGWLTAHTTDE